MRPSLLTTTLDGISVLAAALISSSSKRVLDFRIAIFGSVLVHVIAFAVLHPFSGQFRPPPDVVLQVELAPPEPLPMAPPEIITPPPQPRAPPHVPRVAAKQAAQVQKPHAETPAPVPIANEPPVVSQPPIAESAPVPAPLSSPVPARPAAPGPAPQLAITSPPNFNPAYFNNPRPAYPRLARRNGEEGTVLLRVLVTREGRVARLELDKSSGFPLLDSAALEAVKEWRFVPARKGTESVEDWVRVPIIFRLVDAQ
jgi:periplasmic protein TonB